MKRTSLRTAALLTALSGFIVPMTRASISGVQVLVGGRTNLSGEGTLVEAINLGTTASPAVQGVGTFVGDPGTDGAAGAATLATLNGGVLATADIGSAIDNLFFTETWNSGGTGMKMTYTLPDAGEFLVEILHGEPRSCCTGRFNAVTFSDANGTVSVPEFVIGNGVANQNPPPDADWAIIRARVQGVTQFTYTMPNGIGRGSSIVGFQIRRTQFIPTDTEPFIAEISAAGNTTYKDENGDTPDWIEIYNPTNASVDLTGWHLTNLEAQPSRWTFPDIAVARGARLVVFASAKDRRVPGSRLHTDFKLPASGGYLALTKPDGTVVHAFSPYPAQTDGFGYGVNGLSRAGASNFFYPATPGGANGIGVTAALIAPVFSVKKAVFTATQTVSLSSTFPEGQIRYTTDGTIPVAASTLYSTPLVFSTTTRLRARVFDPVTGGGGEVDTGFYTRLETTSNLNGVAAPAAFNSNLPVLILENFAGGGVPGTSQPLQFMQLAVFEPDAVTGRTTLNRTPDKSVRAGLRVRGQSSSGFPKRQYKLETWNESNGDNDESLLGLPADSDWVLSAPYSDESLLRNPLIFGMGKDFGLPAPGTRYCELFLNTDGGGITSADYAGVYILTESLKIGKNRLDLANVSDFSDNDGGYLIRHEASVANETRLSGWTYGEIHDPLTTPAQTTFISNWVNGLNTAVRSPSFADPVTGYRAWADAGSFARMGVLTEFVRAQDGYVRSAYYYKDRGQKLKAGPLWDYDLSFGVSCCFNSHRTDVDPATGSGWQFNYGYNRGARENGLSDGAHTTAMARLDWMRLMMQDADYKQLFIDTWQTLRHGALSTAGFAARVDALAAQVSDNGAADSPQKRNFIKWGTLGSATTGFQAFLPANLTNASETWAAHVQYVKTWAAARSTWMDSQFVPVPVAGVIAGAVSAGTVVSMTSAHTVYATLNGTDPRQAGGAPNAAATVLPPGNPAPSLTINATSHVIARARNTTTGEWSGPLDLWYIVGTVASPASLMVSELHYHPADPTAAEQLPDNSLNDDDFEFIELKNIGAQTLDLSGAAFVDGIEYTFPSGSTIAPGAALVLVSNAAAFARRYGAGVAVFGEYAGQFDNTGEHVELRYPFGATVFEFTYRDDWHTPTDGAGYSLVALDQTAAADGKDAGDWAISAEMGGSPGGSANGYSLTFDSWRHHRFTAAELPLPGISGAMDDPDMDGVVNLLEYALGTDPRARTAEGELPKAGSLTIGADVFATLTFSRPLRVLDAVYTPEFSYALTGWSADIVAAGPAVPSANGTETVTFRSTVPVPQGGRAFSRLTVGLPPASP
ncbi:MAG TPA: CotH kinase family protein [Verrucomicrobiales bacterium]|nr:CotH kinase family protein [Verrucomicrobiales bacterium]